MGEHGWHLDPEPIEITRDREQALKWGDVIRANGTEATPKELSRMVRELADAAQNPAHVRSQLQLELRHEFGFRNEDIEGIPLYKLAMMILGCAIFYVEDSREVRNSVRMDTNKHHVKFLENALETERSDYQSLLKEKVGLCDKIKRLKKQIKEQKGRVIRTIMLKEDT